MTSLDKILNFVTFGAKDRRVAKDIVEMADSRSKRAVAELEASRQATQNHLVELGSLRSSIYEGSLSDFVGLYERISKASRSPLKSSRLDVDGKELTGSVQTIKRTSASLKEYAAGGGAGVLGGAVAACGAWGLAGLVGTASTGTAIGTLSGVAATNASLAWLGGGTLAAGGTGVAGGMVVLCGVALAPLAVAGMWLGQEAGSRRINEAVAYSKEHDVLIERTQTLIAQLHQIHRAARLLMVITAVMDRVLMVQMESMREVVEQVESRSFFARHLVGRLRQWWRGTPYTTSQEIVLCNAANTAVMLRELLDMRILGEDGALLEGTLEQLAQRRQKMIELTPCLPADHAPLIQESGFLDDERNDLPVGVAGEHTERVV